MGGDKIVLLDGAGANGGGAATNGLLSMIPGMFANLIGGNKNPTDYYGDDRYYGDGPQMRRGRGRGRGRSY